MGLMPGLVTHPHPSQEDCAYKRNPLRRRIACDPNSLLRPLEGEGAVLSQYFMGEYLGHIMMRPTILSRRKGEKQGEKQGERQARNANSP